MFDKKIKTIWCMFHDPSILPSLPPQKKPQYNFSNYVIYKTFISTRVILVIAWHNYLLIGFRKSQKNYWLLGILQHEACINLLIRSTLVCCSENYRNFDKMDTTWNNQYHRVHFGDNLHNLYKAKNYLQMFISVDCLYINYLRISVGSLPSAECGCNNSKSSVILLTSLGTASLLLLCFLFLNLVKTQNMVTYKNFQSLF